MKRIVLAVSVLAVVMLAVPVLADHDAGVDEPWVNAMNQASYWETRWAGLGEVDCTKFDGHTGSIPSGYEAVVVHDGQDVRVYGPDVDGLGAFTASGPMNAGGPSPKHNDGDDGRHSWVMKCNIEVPEQPPTVTVTCETLTVTADDGVEWVVWIGDGFVEGDGTETFQAVTGWFYAVTYNDQVIAEGVFEECTTTTTPPTTMPSSSTTTTMNQTTTTGPEVTTTTPTPTTQPPGGTTVPAPTTTVSTPTELPFTGSEDVPLFVAGLALLGLGAAVLRGRRCDTD